ncbi:MAG TPA: type II toxin-antitoxin system prevent-host-death family antitoxin [Anaerolineae bacterium]|nr:type II toxin-antitoxin system prevent-host-death family antitoxin [Anaerolineae bacterium]
MGVTTVGVRELKARLSAYLRRVKAGATIVITERGRPVGRIVPLVASPEERMRELVEAGMVAWSGQRLPPLAPVARTRGERSVADLLLEDRG